MRKDDVINGYRILEDFTTAGGGLCKWTFAERGGQQYFIKEFLSPKYPTAGSPGSPATKARKLSACQKFETHHRKLQEALVRKCGVGGNLIVTLDFFRWDTTYYKTTERIDVATFDGAEISTMPLDQRLLVLKTVVHSLDILHRQKIVHGDLKPNNVLIKKTDTGNFTTKLIDFDNSFFSGAPPSAEEIVGDMVFYSPEWASYVDPDGGAATSTLTIKSDIFALGLLYCLYIFGTLPALAPPARYPFEAVQSVPLKVGENVRRAVDDATVAGRLTELVEAMLSASAAARPSAPEVLETLKNIRRPAAKAAAGVLGGSLLKKPVPRPPVPAPPAPASKLKGSLLSKKKTDDV